MTQQYIRTYSTLARQKNKVIHPVLHLSNKQRAMRHILRPFGGKTLVFDTETTTDEKQLLRFGFFMIHGLSGEEMHCYYDMDMLKSEDADMLREAGFFYNPATMTEDEIALLKKYAERVTLSDLAQRLGVECNPHEEKQSKLHCMPVTEFVRYFYALQKRDEYMVMGHNLPFDLSRLATDWTEARTTMAGGFSLKLCACKYKQEHHCPNHPNIRIKHIGFAKAFMSRAKTSKKSKTRFPYVIHFLDTQTLSASLLDKAYGLDTLSKMLLPDKPDRQTKKRASKFRKRSRPDGIREGENLTIQDIIYGVGDVCCTYACYRTLRKLYLMHDIDTPIWNLYSSASVGKAHLKMFGIQPFLEAHPDFPPEIIGYSMHAYYGARNEIGIRLKIVEVMYFDFLSQYTTANALMKLQDMLLAESTLIEENTNEVQKLLDQPVDVLLTQLAHPDFWPKLRCFILIKPDGDRLPFRGDYGSESKSVALPYVESSVAVWYTLADVLASKLETDKTPIIEKALSLVPSKEQHPTQKRKLFGYDVDLTKQDLFVTLINIRNDIKKCINSENISEQEYLLLESRQIGLKQTASGTSYGAMVEINQDEDTKEKHDVLYYDIHGKGNHTKVTRVEQTGKYFAGPIGTFIPAAGRLMLAIAERLGRDRGLTYAMMDTDAIAFVRPDGMTRDEFRKRVLEVQACFNDLSPYEGKPPILELEKENFYNDKSVPLYFLGVSSKRYVMWQETEDNKIRIVKFSSHGLGGIHKPYTDNNSPFTGIPEPYKDVDLLGGARWVYDLWYRVIYGLKHNIDLDGESPLMENKSVEPVFNTLNLLKLQIPRFHQLTVSTWNLYEIYAKRKGKDGIDDLRPFSFISILPSHIGNSAYLNIRAFKDGYNNERLAFIKALKRPFYATFASSPDDLHDIRCLDAPYTNMQVPEWFDLFTIAETLRGHFINVEHKAINGDMTGYMQPHTVTVEHESSLLYIGKEIDAIQATIGDETDYLLGDFSTVKYGSSEEVCNWKEILQPYHIADMVVATGLPPRTLQAIRSRKHVPSSDTAKALESGCNLLAENRNFANWRDIPIGELIYLLEVDNKYVMRLMYGKQNITAMQRRIILHKMGIYENEEDDKLLAVKEENRIKREKALSDGSVKNIIHAYLLNNPRARIESIVPHVCTTHPDGDVLSKDVIQPIFEEVKQEMRAEKKKD